jgi:DNA repair protein RadA/Sms
VQKSNSSKKATQYYICANCSYKSLRWLGRCTECLEWDSFTQEVAASSVSNVTRKAASTSAQLRSLNDVKTNNSKRMLTGLDEWDRVMGGGIVPGSFMILTGDPGIGKSTLLLQVAYKLSVGQEVLYFSSEESLEQVKLRSQRLGCLNDQLLFSDRADLEQIVATALEQKPDIVIIDSIQNCYSSNSGTVPGSVAQLREAAFVLMRLAKENTISIIVSGHITKSGNIAGPKTLEHMVDAVFYLQGEDRWQTRVLRSVKNRFGTINEIGLFSMEANGLQEAGNIGQELLENDQPPGSVLVSSLEGSRPIITQIQALTVSSKLTMPQRVVSGMEHKQVVLIAAILEKYLKIRLSSHDIFVKTSGGLRIKGSGSDLGIACALLSSYFQKPLPTKSIVLGEISLTGQIVPTNHAQLQVDDAKKHGVQTIILAHRQKLRQTNKEFIRLKTVYDLLSLFPD